MMAEIQLIRREEVTISGRGHVVREPEHTRLRATDPVIRLHRGSHNDGTTLRVLALVDSGVQHGHCFLLHLSSKRDLGLKDLS